MKSWGLKQGRISHRRQASELVGMQVPVISMNHSGIGVDEVASPASITSAAMTRADVEVAGAQMLALKMTRGTPESATDEAMVD